MKTSIAVTGIGLVSSVGTSIDEIFQAVCEGRSGLVRPPAGHPLDQVVEVMAASPPIDPASVLPAPEARVVDRYIVMALRAAEDALADAAITVGQDVDSYRIGVIVSGVGGLSTLEAQAYRRLEKGRLGVSPYMLAGMLPNMGAARIAMRFGIRGYTSSIGTACAAGAQSLGEAVRLLRADEADVVVCGCSEAPLFPTFADAFGNVRALAHGWPDPTTASRPFDRRRNGFVLGEGAGVFVLERREHAEARGARRYADLLGWGATNDAYRPVAPDPDGTSAAECIRLALRGAGLAPGDIGYVNAHGTGTRVGDSAEAKALRAVFGAQTPPVSSTKGVTGHMLGASGVIEAAICIAAMRRSVLPPTYNLDEPDPTCAVDHVRLRPRVATVEAVLSNSFGFGGHNVSLVFGDVSADRE